MKLTTVAVLAATTASVVVSAQTTGGPTYCPFDETLKMYKLQFEPSLPQCEVDASFRFFSPSNEPTSEQLTRMCSSNACGATLAALKALEPADCVQLFVNGVAFNVHKSLSEFDALCASAGPSHGSLRK